MRILYRNPENQSLSVTSITNTKYLENEGILLFFGDDDICIHADRKTSDKLTRSLYIDGRVDISMYECMFYEWTVDDEEDVEEDDEDYLTIDASDFLLDM